MEVDYQEWNLDRVKMESELMLDDDTESLAHFTGLNEESSHNILITSVASIEQNVLLSTSEPADSPCQFLLSQVKIKEEIVEDISPSGDSQSFHEGVCIKLEHSASEESIVAYTNPPVHLNDGDSEIKVEGMSSHATDFSVDSESIRKQSFESPCDSAVISQKAQTDDDGTKVKSVNSQSKQCSEHSLDLQNGVVIHSSTKLKHSNIPTIDTHTDHHSLESDSSTVIPECAASLLDLTLIESSVKSNNGVGTDLNDAVDDNDESDSRWLLPSTSSSSTEFSAPSNQSGFSCVHCDAQLKTKRSFQQHMLNHTSEKEHSCEVCSARFKRRGQLKDHLIYTHVRDRVFTCNQCSAKFAKKACLRTHLTSHSSEETFACGECSARFKTASKLRTHCLSHSNDKTYSCDKCSARFKTSSLLKKHAVVHSEERAFSCEQCSARFKMASQLKSHSLTHSSEKKFVCDKCSAQFQQKRYLDNHLKTHSDERAFSCSQCNAQFKTLTHLKNHLYTHSDERSFSCEQCPARFKRISHLKRHMLYHSKEKNFTCSYCLANFKRQIDLKHHKSVHSKERTFACDQCSSFFKRKSDLTRHIMSHSAKKNFACGQCSAKFETQIELKGHFPIHFDD